MEPNSPIRLASALATIERYWDPLVVAELNGQQVKLAKVHGDFAWHAHENEDEMFLVLAGRLRLEFRDGAIELGPGEAYVVPRGEEHRPVAEVETHILLFEPASTQRLGGRSDGIVPRPRIEP